MGDTFLLRHNRGEDGEERDKECVDSLPFMAQWDVKTGRQVQVLSQRRAEIPPVLMVFSPDGSAVSATGTGQRRVA